MIWTIFKIVLCIFLAFVVLGVLIKLVLLLKEVFKFIFSILQLFYYLISLLWQANLFFLILSFVVWHLSNQKEFPHIIDKAILYESSFYLYLGIGLFVTIIKIVIHRSEVLLRIPFIYNLYERMEDREYARQQEYLEEKRARDKETFVQIREKEKELVKSNFEKMQEKN